MRKVAGGLVALVAGLVLAFGLTADAHHRPWHKGGKTTPTTTTTPPPTTTTPPPTTTTPPPPPPSGLDPSGQAMPVGDLPGWTQVWADNFPTNVPLGSFPAAVSGKWGAYPDGWPDTTHHGTYMPSKVVSINGGLMDLWLHTENGVHMVSAPQPRIFGPGTNAGRGALYGRYAIRFRADALHGYKTAWLLWPDSEVWPRDGEIDFPEGDLDGTISGFMHRQGATSGGDQAFGGSSARYPDWHTAVIEWLPGRCRFILDGATILDTTDRVPNTPMHWVIQTETWLSSTPPADSVQGHVQIDWAVAYRPA